MATKRADGYQEVARMLGQHIRRQYKPGDMLPSEAGLAKQYSVSAPTISKALVMLSNEGLVQRYRRRGTVVTDPLITGEFAIVLGSEMLVSDVSPFYPLTINAINGRLKQHNERFRSRFHVGAPGVTDHEFPETVDLLEPKVLADLRGVFTFKLLYDVAELLESRGIPVITIGAGTDHAIWYSKLEMIRQGVEHLVNRGSRRLGMVAGRVRPAESEGDVSEAVFAERVAEVGAETRPEWIACIEQQRFEEQDGYDLFEKVWAGDDRPDGLLVTDDILCRGVLRAITRRNIGLPAPLRVVSHANEGVTFPFHLSVSRLQTSPDDFAREAVDMMMSCTRGQTVAEKEVLIPLHLVQGQTT